ncbi:hypothetical protein O0L34_g18159 [Tuta absoluta]|nr:hypothetical protein O0L34_g18159 [Tuta absoluta]
MSSKFTGFSEEDLMRIKSGESGSNSAPHINTPNARKITTLGARPKRPTNPYKLPVLQKQDSDDNIESLFDKCKLSIKTPTSPNDDLSNHNYTEDNKNESDNDNNNDSVVNNNENNIQTEKETTVKTEDYNEIERKDSTISSTSEEFRRPSSDSAPDLVRCVDGYTEGEIAAHKAKLEELQLQQKIMEEQNKKRKEMLAKALADRTKQTTEEVQRLEKIKRELQILDGRFSQDVAVLRKKIDQACLTYAEAEKHYLKVEKDFLQAKIQLQKEKEKKELLTEHLCTLITHNETRKAQKLETLMLELANDKVDVKSDINIKNTINDDDENPIIIDGVDQKTGKIVEYTSS